MAICCNVLLVK